MTRKMPAPDRRPVPGDRPLADCLDTFWQARIPAAHAEPATGADARVAAGSPVPGTVLAELGASGITVRGRPLEAALGPAYRLFTGGG
ncbi:hypothetical protein ACF9IK_05730 [Kitasatospora hibisci]|uniref:hypothetical protein n=1 Tax=Kitasatospora hibisci TaxID=3369522 RepID=UPI0037541582